MQTRLKELPRWSAEMQIILKRYSDAEELFSSIKENWVLEEPNRSSYCPNHPLHFINFTFHSRGPAPRTSYPWIIQYITLVILCLRLGGVSLKYNVAKPADENLNTCNKHRDPNTISNTGDTLKLLSAHQQTLQAWGRKNLESWGSRCTDRMREPQIYKAASCR